MKSVVALSTLAVLGIAGTAASVAYAAPLSTKTPSIVIKSPVSGSVIQGHSVTLTVAVSNFKLVSVQLTNPPILKGNQGHIHYILDSIKNFRADRDMSVLLTHTWTNVPPGRHMLIAYLATSQHLPFPTARQARVKVTVAADTPIQHPASRHPAGGAGVQGVGSAPTTGGAALLTHGSASLDRNIYLLLAGLCALVIGLAFLGRRLMFATTGTGRPMPLSQVPPNQRDVSADRLAAEVGPLQAPATVAFRDAGAPMPGDIEDSSREEESVTDVPRSVSSEVPATEQSTVPPFAPEQAAVSEPWVRPVVPESAREIKRSPLPWELPAPAASSAGPTPDAAPAPESGEAEVTRARALEMAQQWSSVVEDLVRQLELQETERTQMLERISTLEESVRAHDSLRAALTGATDDPVSHEELQAVQYVTDSLIKDPDHIVVLASVAQHADRLSRVVKNYARIHKALGES